MNIKEHNNRSGLTLMELLVVILILGILVTFGMLAIKMMNREYAQRKMPQAIYNNLKSITGEVMSRNRAPSSIEAQGFIAREKLLPPFNTGTAGFCEAFKRVSNVKKDFNCAKTYTYDGLSATGGGDIGNEMFIMGLGQSRTCWNGQECLQVYVSIKKDDNEKPKFQYSGSINSQGKISGHPVDHFGFSIYRNGFVEPMINSVSIPRSSIINPYGVAAEMVTVDVIIDSVDQYYRNRQVSLANILNRVVPANSIDNVFATTKGDKQLFFHNSSNLEYFTSLGTEKKSHSITSNATNFVNPVISVDATGGRFCDFGLACRVGFHDNIPAIEVDGHGVAIKTKEIFIPDFRKKQMNDANVLFYKIPYRRALAIKNFIEYFSFTSGTNDVCASDSRCVQRRIASLREYDDNNTGSDVDSQRNGLVGLGLTYNDNTCRNASNCGSARQCFIQRRICRLIEVSLR